MENVQQLADWMRESRRAVFFGGAGVSTESGIPDFRSASGIYQRKFPYPAETMLSHDFFIEHPREFYDFYRNVMLYPDAEPNAAHETLAKWENEKHLAAVVTQNVDGLHQKAGSKNVYELHGSVYKNRCTRCGRKYGLDAILNSRDVPKCSCGGSLKPEVVLYGEGLDEDTVSGAVEAIAEADLLIVGGTSLAVYPAAGFLNYYEGHRLVLVNLQPTPYDDRADLVICGKIGQVLTECDRRMRK